MRIRSRLWQIGIAAALLTLSLLFYLIRWNVFPTAVEHREMLRYVLGDIAFLFLQVWLVTVFIDGVTQYRQRMEIRQRLTMVVGAFFSEAGTALLGTIAGTDSALSDVREDLVARVEWTPADFKRAAAAFSLHDAKIDLTHCDLQKMRAHLAQHKPYILGLLGNQNLHEHEKFTDTLWAITHLAEELEARTDLEGLTHADLAHLTGDVRRAYLGLGRQWIEYLRHLSANYPFLYSLAVRTNPLDPSARAAVTG